MPLRNNPSGWCPWEAAAQMNVRVIQIPMTAGYYGASIWHPKTIYLKRGIPPGLARCVLTRELLRLRRPALVDSSSAEVVRQERALTNAAARLLIPIGALVEAVRLGTSRQEQAEMLAVDERTLHVRVKGLTEEEWSAVTSIVDVVSA